MIEPTDKIGRITLYNADCMEVMKTFKDKQFSLAIVDPPYGIGFANKIREAKTKNWDNSIPTDEYFSELKRVSKNQIIWGGNYFNLHPTRCFIFWYKHQPVKNFSDGELAWTSFNSIARCFDYPYFGNINTEQQRIHPTQKPIKLYEWLLLNYAKEGDTILDTHFGSLSIGIACEKLGFELTAIELDKDYYQMAKKRLLDFKKQLTIKF